MGPTRDPKSEGGDREKPLRFFRRFSSGLGEDRRIYGTPLFAAMPLGRLTVEISETDESPGWADQDEGNEEGNNQVDMPEATQ